MGRMEVSVCHFRFLEICRTEIICLSIYLFIYFIYLCGLFVQFVLLTEHRLTIINLIVYVWLYACDVRAHWEIFGFFRHSNDDDAVQGPGSGCYFPLRSIFIISKTNGSRIGCHEDFGQRILPCAQDHLTLEVESSDTSPRWWRERSRTRRAFPWPAVPSLCYVSLPTRTSRRINRFHHPPSVAPTWRRWIISGCRAINSYTTLFSSSYHSFYLASLY